MRKILTFIGMLVLIFTIAACDSLPGGEDTIAPIIYGTDDVTINVNDVFNITEGVIVVDNEDGDITSLLSYVVMDEVGNIVTLDLAIPGVYIIKYSVTDAAGNQAVAERILTINGGPDSSIPVLQIGEDITVYVGYPIDPLESVTAMDSEDGTISDNVTFQILDSSGFVIADISNLPVGVYTIIYTIVDNDGNVTEGQRTLTVMEMVNVDIELKVMDLLYAEEALVQFYDNIFDETMAAEEICQMYIGDVPFPINNTTVAECVGGISEIRSKLTSAFVMNVFEITLEEDIPGNVGYQAEVVLTDIYGETMVGDVVFGFLGLIGETEGYIHFFSDPFMNDGGGNGIDPEYAHGELQFLIDSFFDVMYDAHTFCNDILGPSVGGYLDVDQCTARVDEARYYVDYIQIQYVEHSEITFPDGNMGEGFRANITISIAGSIDNYDVYFFFIQDPNNGEPIQLILLSDLLGGAFQEQIDSVILPNEEAFALLEGFYFDMMDPNYLVDDFCMNYISYAPNAPMLDECVGVIHDIRIMVEYIDIIDVMQAPIDTGDGGMIEGYIAHIQFLEIETNEIIEADIRFAIIEMNMDYYIVMLDHPLGYHDGGGGMYLIPVDITFAWNEIDMFYQGIVDPNVDLYTFCEAYMMNLFFEYHPEDVQNCAEGLNNLRMGLQGFTIIDVHDYEFYSDGFSGPAYKAIIEMIDMNGDIFTIEVVFGFFESPEGAALIVLSNPGGEPGLQFEPVNVPIEYAETELFNLYQVILDPSYDSYQFCMDYIDGVPFGPSLEECQQAVEDIRSMYDVFSIQYVDFAQVMFDDGMYVEGYTAFVILDGFEAHMEFNIDFIFIDYEGTPRIVLLGHPGGMDDHHGPHFELIPTDLTLAWQEIDLFYLGIVDPNVDLYAFCEGYMMDLFPDYHPEDVQSCADGLYNLRMGLQSFMIVDVYEHDYYGDGVNGPGFIALIEMTDIYGNMFTVEIMFGFVESPNGPALVVLSNPGGEQGPPPYNPIDVPLPEAELLINELYTQILDPSFDHMLLCMDYTMVDPYGPSLEECEQAMIDIRNTYDTFMIHFVDHTQIDFGDGHWLNGYRADITLTGVDMQYDFSIDFMIVDHEGEFEVILFGHPGGMDQQMPIMYFMYVDVLDAETQLSIFYEMVMDETVDLVMYCEAYHYGLPVQVDPNECAMGLENLRNGLVEYTFLGTTYQFMIQDGYEGEVYVTTIEMLDVHGELHVFDVYYGFIEVDGLPKIVITSNPGWGGNPPEM